MKNSYGFGPLLKTGDYPIRARAIATQVRAEAQAAGEPLAEFSPACRLEEAKRLFAFRLDLAVEVLGCTKGDLADRLGIGAPALSALLAALKAPRHRTELALYRVLLAEALDRWIAGWALPERIAEYRAVYQANPLTFGGLTIPADEELGLGEETSPGHPITDDLTRAIHALAAVAGPQGWADFWRQIGGHIVPPPAYQNSAEYWSNYIAQGKREARAAAGA